MRSKHLSIRRALVVWVGIPVAWFAIWLVLGWIAQAAGIKLLSGTETGALFALLGGILGAVFTLGGLVIALVAVLSQLTLDNRARQVLDDEFNKLVKNVEEKADRRAAGRLAFRDALGAIGTLDMKRVDECANEVAEYYPDLPDWRSTLALRLSNDYDGSLFRGAINNSPNLNPDLRTTAIVWLDRAHEQHDNPYAQVSAAQALVYGRNGDYDRMLAALQETIRIDPDKKEHFTAPDHLAMLMYACKGDINRIRQVGKILSPKCILPVPEPEVRDAVDRFVATPDHPSIDWYTVEKSSGQLPPRVVSVVKFWGKLDADGSMVYLVLTFDHGANDPKDNMGRTIPPYMSPPIRPPEGPYDALDVVLERLFAKYWFICECQMVW